MATSMALLSLSSSSTDPRRETKKEVTYHIELIGPQHPRRASLQDFIADIFFKTYGAEVSHFCDTLVGCRGDGGRWVAALGFSLAKDGRTFLEQYLDAPLECEIASRTSVPVGRQGIVEVGNLAATHAGAAREMIAYMTRHLYQQGLLWVAFTATRGLLNSFGRLRIEPILLGDADPRRLPGSGNNWGTYYASQPQVMAADIRTGYAQLAL